MPHPSSLSPAPYLMFGEPGYNASNPILPDGYPQSIAEWLQGFPPFTKQRLVDSIGQPPLPLMWCPAPGGTDQDVCAAIVYYPTWWVSLTVHTLTGSWMSRELSALPPRVLADPFFAGHIERHAETRGTRASDAETGATLVSAAAVRAALDLPVGTRNSYRALRAAIESVLDGR